MTYQEAKEKLRKIAGKRAAAITYETMMYADGRDTAHIALYIADIGYTNFYSKTFEAAFVELAALMCGGEPSAQEPDVQESDTGHSSRTHHLAGYVLGPSESEE